MSNTSDPITSKSPQTRTEENNHGVANHKQTAVHLEEAAKLHHEASKSYGEGNHEKGASSVLKAQGHLTLANELQRENSKKHVQSK
jgi:hypothetical protein